MKRYFLALLFLSSLVRADLLFSKGTLALGVAFGGGSVAYDTRYGSISKEYFIVGIGADYFIVDNLSVGMSLLSWVGNSPTVMQYTLPVTYYFKTNSAFSPYGGIYYRYTDYVGSYKDAFGKSYDAESLHSLGGRAGVAYRVSFGYIGIGFATDKSLKNDATSTYPEFTAGFVF